METVLHALKAMGKANSVELAARLDISREEVLNELWELKKNGVVDKTGHTWFLAVEGESRVTEERPVCGGHSAVTAVVHQKTSGWSDFTIAACG
nr:Lrp/AsnC family transcriptional regulator [Escherichia coli]